ncbi:hypothetical protein RclHR1_00280030 [Rhizophagus clarus]|uniref:Uncharacterized protein n=1 Tax=Rhizophagus clarus TaxID=94130 RepID=A0A2Z6RXH6_9GLOM|nr:hypothetical protein RclHR1_00280030 [Rhizophagus clarus]GES83751.1 hypothetical protein RCL_jg9539.t1 [Rhizophagus clarus]
MTKCSKCKADKTYKNGALRCLKCETTTKSKAVTTSSSSKTSINVTSVNVINVDTPSPNAKKLAAKSAKEMTETLIKHADKTGGKVKATTEVGSVKYSVTYTPNKKSKK